MDNALKNRMLKGAAVLGGLWRDSIRCQRGWSIACDCTPPTKFCEAKALWFSLLAEAGRELPAPDDPVGILRAMTEGEFESSRMTMTVAIGERQVVVGPGGMRWRDLFAMPEDPEAARAVLAIMGVFPGSTITGIPPKGAEEGESDGKE